MTRHVRNATVDREVSGRPEPTERHLGQVDIGSQHLGEPRRAILVGTWPLERFLGARTQC